MSKSVRKPEEFVLVLQGGGALGSYQAGVFEALAAGGLAPDWVAGISIGAINAALIAGNPPERRVERLRGFWERATSGMQLRPLWDDRQCDRPLFVEFSAGWIAAAGVPGFFAPRMPPPFLQFPGTPEALSFYDTAPLRATLEEMVDFDLINRGKTRLSVGAVNVRSGNFIYFDSRHSRIGPEHIMASGALPPAFPPVEIDGELYWDGGLVSNTPLQYVLDQEQEKDLTIAQVDLFSAEGQLPRTMLEAAERDKDIRYSSRTRVSTDMNLRLHRVKSLIRELIDEAPKAVAADPRIRELEAFSKDTAVTVMHLINRHRGYDSATKDYEFSRVTMLELWAAGTADVQKTLADPQWIGRGRPTHGIAVFDLGHGSPHHEPSTDRAPDPAKEHVG
ncbi:MAG TPA: patatin-like phospholipase family protein [Caulobacteraceae bacterium]|jgi:NTE family protein|nr:patatin-like phospholipase family protein [Caulobacteraceae bacterium]